MARLRWLVMCVVLTIFAPAMAPAAESGIQCSFNAGQLKTARLPPSTQADRARMSMRVAELVSRGNPGEMAALRMFQLRQMYNAGMRGHSTLSHGEIAGYIVELSDMLAGYAGDFSDTIAQEKCQRVARYYREEKRLAYRVVEDSQSLINWGVAGEIFAEQVLPALKGAATLGELAEIAGVGMAAF